MVEKNKSQESKKFEIRNNMASGGILCEQIQPPHLGHPIEAMDFLDNLSK
jgi:hypothetical protein